MAQLAIVIRGILQSLTHGGLAVIVTPAMMDRKRG